MTLAGRIVNPYSNLVIARIADARSTWDASDRRYNRAVGPIVDRGKPGAMNGDTWLVRLGGLGSAHVVRHGREWTLASHGKSDDWSPALEPALAKAAAAPLSRDALRVGELEIPSGRMLLLHGPAAKPSLPAKRAPVIALRDDIDPIGLAVTTPAGRYEIVVDREELSGPYGDLECRVRIRPVATDRPRARASRGR